MTEEIQHYVKCPLCSSKDYFIKYHFSKNRYNHNYFITHSWDGGHNVELTIVKCMNCNFVYQNPIFKDEFLNSLYPETIIPTELTNKDFTRNYDFLYSLIFKHQSKKKNLISIDIGTRYGQLPNFLKTKSYTSIGIEMNNACVLAAKKYGINDIYCGKIGDIKTILNSYQADTIDLITMIDVIEHLTDINEDFKIISSLQKKDQLLCFTTMFNDSIGGFLFGKEWYYIHAQHTLYFSKKTIKLFLKKYDYELIEYFHVPLHKSFLHVFKEFFKLIKHKLQIWFHKDENNKKWFAENRPHCLDLITVIAKKIK
jgi:2-polyprenyl-3-methyl-5-hydroxy-6-metoxy-1,4-benzoquinol methylase